MGIIEVVFNLSLVSIFVYSVVRALDKGVITEAIIISCFFPTLVSIMGIESFRTLGYLILMFVCAVFLVKNNPTLKINLFPEKKSYLLVVMTFIFVFVANSVFSKAIGGTYYFQKLVGTLLFIFLPMLMIVLCKDKKSSGEVLVSFLIISSIITAFILIYNAYLFGFEKIFEANFFPRLSTSEETNPIWLGRFISIGLILNVVFTKRRLTKILIALLLIVSVIFTGSKSVLIFPIITIFIYFNFLNSNKSVADKFKNFGLIIIIVSAITYILMSLNPAALERRFSTNSGTINDREGRYDIVLDAYNEEENYLFGNGIGSVSYPLSYSYNERDYPHNINIEMLYEFGIIGVLLFNILLIFPLILLVRKRNRSKLINSYVSLVILFMLYAQTSGDLIVNNIPFIFGVYLICLIPNNSTNESSLFI